MLKDWEIVHEMDDEETGLPTGYAKEFNGEYFWVTQFSDGWHVEINPYKDYYETLKTNIECMRATERRVNYGVQNSSQRQRVWCQNHYSLSRQRLDCRHL